MFAKLEVMAKIRLQHAYTFIAKLLEGYTPEMHNIIILKIRLLKF